ncbi:DUF1778 domain-containing protein [Variovorax ureilyticus]|uniref:type II toxin-antitoxin system TacA family antitoxin n=1 Tax=Variovorax ureilyticus TaxID=1836198 RepID=UPI003D6740C6
MHDVLPDPADQVLFSVDAEQFCQFAAMLNAPPTPNPGLQRLMKVQAPWTSGPSESPDSAGQR